MILEKVYDELYGMIEDLKKKIDGGSTVTITPTLESGVKIADYVIDETSGSIYAPQNIHSYSTVEHIVGTWIDGTTPVYECVVYTETQTELSNSDWTSIPWENEPTDIDLLISAEICGVVPNNSNSVRFIVDNGHIKGASLATNDFPPSVGTAYVVFRYTKTPPIEAKKTTKKSK